MVLMSEDEFAATWPRSVTFEWRERERRRDVAPRAASPMRPRTDLMSEGPSTGGLSGCCTDADEAF